MWKYNGKTIKLGRSWSDSKGNQYPSNWIELTTDAEKKAVGLVWEDDPKPYDSRFYYAYGKEKPLSDLKATYIKEAKDTAHSYLVESDWYIVRKAEDSTTTIPTNITTYRTAVRTACTAIEKSITDATDLAAFIALWDVPVDSDGNPTGKAPINNWPDPL